MKAALNAKHDKVRARLASDVAAFLSNGGVVEEVDYTANQGWRQRHQQKYKQRPPSIILSPKRKNADHPWTELNGRS